MKGVTGLYSLLIYAFSVNIVRDIVTQMHLIYTIKTQGSISPKVRVSVAKNRTITIRSFLSLSLIVSNRLYFSPLINSISVQKINQ